MPSRIFSLSLKSELNNESLSESGSESYAVSGGESNSGSNSEADSNADSGTKQDDKAAVKAVKFLFMYKYPAVKELNSHKLNVFTYKNVLFANDQIVFFESTNEGDPVRNKNENL
jgi:hypothetical protein